MTRPEDHHPEDHHPEDHRPEDHCDEMFNALFSQAKGHVAEPSPEFLGRLLEDAYAAQPVAATAPQPLRAHAEPWLRQWLRRLAPPAGLATAGLAGFWLGFAQPAALVAPVTSLSDTVTGTGEVVEMVDLIPSLDGWLAEG